MSPRFLTRFVFVIAIALGLFQIGPLPAFSQPSGTGAFSAAFEEARLVHASLCSNEHQTLQPLAALFAHEGSKAQCVLEEMDAFQDGVTFCDYCLFRQPALRSGLLVSVLVFEESPLARYGRRFGIDPPALS